jgi:hypothetical protein
MALSLQPWKVELSPSFLERVNTMADELSRQSAHLAAAEYRWLRLLGEFDQIGGWGVTGTRSCAAWLSWACGLSLPAARERVRVARALPALPLVSAAFAAGRLSYSKVRAVTRVATTDNEQLLVDYATSATAAQLETVIRGYRRSQRAEEAKDAARAFEQRCVRWWVDDDGFVRITARLPAEDGALVVAQLERLATSGGEDNPAPPAEPASRVSAETAEAGRGDAPLVSEGWEASEPIEARRADALRIMAETAAAHGPTACVDGETHLVVVHVEEDELRSDAPVDDAGPVDGASAGKVIDAEDLANAVATHIEGIGRVSAETARRIACDAQITTLVEDALGRPLGVGRSAKNVPRWLRRALMRRDRGTCVFPNCSAQRFLHAHHIVHWADDGPTDLENLALLCSFHHRLVHEVGYVIDVLGPGEFTFLRPDGTVVPAAMPQVVGEEHAVEEANTERGLAITEFTPIPDWDGRPPDYSAAIAALADVSAESPGTALLTSA